MGAALALAVVVPSAAPAAADSSACTHHWSGPQVCIRLEGRNGWNSVTGIWVNPPTQVKTRTVRLFLDGHQLNSAQTARRVGTTLSYHWQAFDTGTDVKVCVRFKEITRVACDKTKYIGNRTSL
ncbi:hypothetical protein [Streptomyces sp. SID2888]|uniref:hypothetical protein n=1 Tax=Streptomyces sp. SID2888 TaxID=2690256 RepID=UPI0013703D4F|nr:hypothetical protein [Streptomyces sp. SID2888]MYV47801.1 hypothetical protein [Streptomyces sp. SID2888]